MKQIIQSYKTGKMELVDIAPPDCGHNGILIETSASLISAGTEKMLIELANKSLLGKAKARPDLVKQVLNKVKKEGLVTTFQKVMTKLEIPIPLGYSCAGNVIMVGKNLQGILPGDRVACGGAGFANHAEINYVPKNLFVRVPESVSDEEAAFATVGSIALQGVRQLDPTLGEKIIVIGIGLIGLITVQILKANGCDVLAVDLDQRKLKIALDLGADSVCLGKDLSEAAGHFSKGIGVDGVIITASSKSSQPLVDAGISCRQKGRIVMVGMMPIEIPRDIYYKKELDFRLSMSYGPGRYDEKYELLGQDYPLAYVRWTEQRNLESVLNLIAQQRLNVKALITHRYAFENVLEAYQLITGEQQEFFLGVILQYSLSPEKLKPLIAKHRPHQVNTAISLGVVGAGGFAQSVALPQLKKTDCEFHVLMESNPVNARIVSEKYRFLKQVFDYDLMLQDQDVNTILIMTPHDSHAALAIQALKAGKHVFVEKPLAINEAELEAVKESFLNSQQHLTVGYNRRFSAHAEIVRQNTASLSTPLIMDYQINAGPIPANHWIQNPEIGGGRIIGEVCHFIDFMQFCCGSLPTSVFASAIRTDHCELSNNDSLQIIIEFANGSIGSIGYHALGDVSLPKEYFELSGSGMTAKIFDFKKTQITQHGKTRIFKTNSQDKGFRQEYKSFFHSIQTGSDSPITFESLFYTTLATFRIVESIQTGLKLEIK